jgi:pimeloyl-ACP methyl ester carboxylesterase
MLTETQEAEHRKIGHDGIPVVAIWGDKDKVIPLKALGILTQWNRAVRQETIAEAGHGLPYTHGIEAAALIRGILRERD